jgi:hypothetical protein
LLSQTETVAVCASAGTIQHGQTITGTVFPNSCVPGARPRDADASRTVVECGGLCAPNEVTSTDNQADEGGIAPNSCQLRWGAAPPSSATAGESCRYFWGIEQTPGLTRFSNTLGFCFKHAVWQYDSNGDMAPDSPWPRCTTLTTGDVLPPLLPPGEGNDAREFWCLPKEAMKRAAPAQRPAPRAWDQRLTGWR